MLISLSGRMNSGKDTVGKIIKILTSSPHFNNKAVIDFLDRDLYDSDWEIKKFADKLKDIVCLLLNVDRKTLEDREFKEKELGPEWDRIIASDGKIYLPDEYPDLEYSKLTPRLLLQIMGTQIGREIIHPNLWGNALMSGYKPNWTEETKQYWKDKLPEYPNWIITDTRFENELKAVKDRGGITIRVNRPGLVESNHLSETSLDSATFDYVIDNNSGTEELVEKVREILIKENIIPK